MSGFVPALASEWVKVRSLRSTYLILGLAVVLGLGVGLLELGSVARHWATLPPEDRAAFDPVADSFTGFEYAELALGAFGVLVGTGEYTTGTIAATLASARSRMRVYVAKLVVLAGLIVAVSLACSFAAFLLGQQALAGAGLGTSLDQPHVLRAVLGAGMYLSVVTLVGFGLGVLLRHTAGAMGVMVTLVFLAWPVARAVESYSYVPDRWLLVNAADALVSVHAPVGPNVPRTPSLGMAALELVVYLVVFLALGAWRASRDA